MNRALAVVAFLFFAAFLAILGFGVPSPDLLIVITLTLCLAAFDFWKSVRRRK